MVTLLEKNDEHWYRLREDQPYLPSVSVILGTMKDGLEFVSPYDLRKAQERGTKVHKASELIEQGEELSQTFYTDQEWLMIAGFIRWRQANPGSVIASEQLVADGKRGYGGTIDRVYCFPEKTVLVDIKTASSITQKHWMQVAAYAKICGKKIDKVAILRLSDKTRSGYQYVEKDDWSADWKAFESIFKVWKYQNPEKQPTILDLPDTLSFSSEI
jgi:hypothetical protein